MFNKLLYFYVKKEFHLNLKEASKLFASQFPIFFIFGLVLLSGISFYNEKTAEFVLDSFNEHLAMNSIILIFLLCMLMTGLFLLIFGSYDKTKKSHEFIYKNIISPPVELGITLSAVAFSLSLSLAVILAFDDKAKALTLAINSIYIIGIAFSYWGFFTLIQENSYIDGRRMQAFLGGFLILGVPFIGWVVIPQLMLL